MITRKIPSSRESLPVIGLGTWQTFDAESSDYPKLKEVLNAMHAGGGRMIDSSPMYGRAEKVIGELTIDSKVKNDFFYATKVWTTGREAGIKQMESSQKKMGRSVIDLMQIHNLTDWKTHLKTLKDWKAAGKVRYVGITHYTDGSHSELEQIISSEKIDFVQFNYSIDNRHSEKRLIKAAADNHVATIVNRPFVEGRIFQKIKNKPLPGLAKELGIATWSQFFLSYIIADPSVTVVIPATANPVHAAENLATGGLILPDQHMRNKMIYAFEQ